MPWSRGAGPVAVCTDCAGGGAAVWASPGRAMKSRETNEALAMIFDIWVLLSWLPQGLGREWNEPVGGVLRPHQRERGRLAVEDQQPRPARVRLEVGLRPIEQPWSAPARGAVAGLV